MDLLATSNQATNTIIGASQGSKTYYHEEAHIEYAKSPLGSRLSLAEDQFKTLALFSIVLAITLDNKVFTWGALAGICFSLLINIAEEIICWIRGLRKWRALNQK